MQTPRSGYFGKLNQLLLFGTSLPPPSLPSHDPFTQVRLNYRACRSDEKTMVNPNARHDHLGLYRGPDDKCMASRTRRPDVENHCDPCSAGYHDFIAVAISRADVDLEHVRPRPRGKLPFYPRQRRRAPSTP